MAAVDGKLISNLWTAPVTETSQVRQITSLSLPLSSVMEGPNGKLLANSYGKLWTFTSEGKQRQRFTDLDLVSAVTVCGQFVVLVSRSSDGRTSELVRFDADGSNPKKLLTGGLALPVCAPDGRNVFYVETGPPRKIWRIPVEGGTPVEVAKVLGEDLVGRLSISADGKMIAYPFEKFTPIPATKIAIIPSDGGPLVKILDAPGGVYVYGSPLLSTDGRSLEYVLTRNGSSNIWEQMVQGGLPHQVTKFTSGQIFDFNWSRDGKRLLLARGEFSSDVVLVSHLH